MNWIDIWGDREFRVHSDCTLSFVTTFLHIENKGGGRIRPRSGPLDFFNPIFLHCIQADRTRQGEHFGTKYMGICLNLYG
jgi:hypothetical protein